jgi:SAM-dependent methyltransferase
MNRTVAGADEIERIAAEYRRRAAVLPGTRDSMLRPATLFVYQQRVRQILRALTIHRLVPLRDTRILDVGCGGGQLLIDFESWGARRENLAGIDLLEENAAFARVRLCSTERAADIRTGNAAELPWPDRSFDIVAQFTVFTSILSAELRRAVAAEMIRVTRPGGVVLWYDFRVNNPQNAQVRRVGARELRTLFPGCELHLMWTTLAPPLARRLVPLSWTLAEVLEKLRVLNTHYLAVIRRPADSRSPFPA